jgi:hypothetical protein
LEEARTPISVRMRRELKENIGKQRDVKGSVTEAEIERRKGATEKGVDVNVQLTEIYASRANHQVRICYFIMFVYNHEDKSFCFGQFANLKNTKMSNQFVCWMICSGRRRQHPAFIGCP